MKKIQTKLIQILIFSSTVPLMLVAAITLILLEGFAISEAQKRVSHYLDMGEEVLFDMQRDLRYIVRDQNRRIYTLLEQGETERLISELSGILRENGLDFFVVTDNQGVILISLSNPDSQGIDIGKDNYVQNALVGEAMHSVDILDLNDTSALGFSKRAVIPGSEENRAMIIRASLPVINREEQIIGSMNAGYLINNSRLLVDRIKKATGLFSCVYLDGLRISSNFVSQSPSVAVGSSIGSSQARQVLLGGRRYSSRQRLENIWYIAGYTPVYDDKNNIIGSICVGIPEVYIFGLRNNLTIIFGIAAVVSIVLALLFGLIKGSNIVKSVQKLARGAEAISKGDFNYKINISTGDEIEELANVFNKMTAQLKAAREQIEGYSRELERKIEEKARELEAAQNQLIQYEKMAAMGRMATTLGHELRNVFAGIHTITYWMKGRVVKNYPELLNSVKDLEYEVNYANDILDNVLRFSRPQKPMVGEVNVNVIIEDIVTSLNLEEMFKDIEVVKKISRELPEIRADGVQIKEVLLNIIMNAVQAMPKGGRLTITSLKEDEKVKVLIQDTGTGITKEAQEDLFTPFFTTKNRGLGLGLSISKEIIDAHKGKIEIETELDKGTTFIITLPFKKTV